VTFSPDGAQMLVNTYPSVRLWDTFTWKPLSGDLGEKMSVEDADFNVSGSRILLRPQLSFFEIPKMSGNPPKWLEIFATAISGLQFTTDGDLISLSAAEISERRDQLIPFANEASEWGSLLRWCLEIPKNSRASPSFHK